jgi:hypothetical protein
MVTGIGLSLSHPVTGDPQGWQGEVVAQASDDWYARVHAVCENVAP